MIKRWIRRTLGRIVVNALWGSYLKDGGYITATDAEGQQYEWLPAYGDWEPVTIEWEEN